MNETQKDQCLDHLKTLGLKIVAGPHHKFLPGKKGKPDLHLIRVKACISSYFAQKKLGVDKDAAERIKQKEPTSLRFVLEINEEGDVQGLRFISTSARKREGASRSKGKPRRRTKGKQKVRKTAIAPCKCCLGTGELLMGVEMRACPSCRSSK